MLNDLIGWYLAPWRRMGRLEFGAFLAAASVPGFFLMITGLAGEASGWLAPIMSMLDIGKQASDAAATNFTDPGSLQSLANQLNGDAFMPGAAGAADSANAFDWAGLVNNLLMILLIPLTRMRLRDMGKTGRTELLWTALLSLTFVDGLLQVFGLDILPMGWLFSVVSFGGFIWLCMARSAPKVAPYERIPAPGPDDTRRQDP